MKELIKSGAKLDLKDESDQTPLAVAERFGNQKVVEYLKTQAENDAPAIQPQARLAAGGMNPKLGNFRDPLEASSQENDLNNLERIVQTANLVSGQAPPQHLTPEVVQAAAAKGSNEASSSLVSSTTTTFVLVGTVAVLLASTTFLLGVLWSRNKQHERI